MTISKSVGIETRKYQNTHLKSHNGFGVWVFEAIGHEGFIVMTPAMNYTEAKRLAILEAKTHIDSNFITLVVMP